MTGFAYWSELSRKITLIPLWYKDLSLPCRCLQEVPLSLLAVRTSFARMQTRMRLCRTDQGKSSPFKSRLRPRLVLWSIAFEDDCYGSCIPLVAVRFCSAPYFFWPRRRSAQPLHGRSKY